ncbi:MAG TPA: DEDD exonuclease domain-containing protein [Actinomycetota bacterium]|nr:DEDD exonuclease domain-containing protein [Actinomycetota bacterium]
MRAATARRPLAAPRQKSFDDLQAPLHEVTFCAVDLETTGGSPKTCEIVEIGAAKSRGGHPLGSFSTFVRPAGDLPPQIQLLTGIVPSMLAGAEPLPAVLPTFLEFLGPSVFVAHNARFDMGFIAQACRLLDYEPPEVVVLDTAKLARRLIRSEVRDLRLATLAAFFRTTNSPCHRAFPDAAACLEVLYGLLERASAYGVTTLAELVELQRPSSGPHFEKVRMARDLPRRRGVYMFRNARGEIIYVGKATDLRARVRSYFVSDERKRITDLLAEVSTVDVVPCELDVEAEALEARLIERLTPRYNRRGVRRRSPVFLTLTKERHPRFSVVRKPPAQGLCIGPFSSRARAEAAATTLAGLWGVRTCSLRLKDDAPVEPCPLYALGSCHGPCTGRPQDVESHDSAVLAARGDLSAGLDSAREKLRAKLERLASGHRFEEAAAHRDAFAELVRVVARAGVLQALAAAGRVVLECPEGRVVLRDGRLESLPGPPVPGPESPGPSPAGGPGDVSLSVPAEGLPERSVVASWLDRAEGVRFVESERPLSYPWPKPRSPESLEV